MPTLFVLPNYFFEVICHPNNDSRENDREGVCLRGLRAIGGIRIWVDMKCGKRVICANDLGWVNVKKDILDSFGVIFGKYNLKRLIIVSRTNCPQLELALRHAFSRSFGKIIVISLYFVELALYHPSLRQQITSYQLESSEESSWCEALPIDDI
jgi:hypothetical protein